MGDFYWSSILLLGCFVFDALDGMVARWLNVSSEFGKQLDSIADVISFGVAPAYLYSLLSPDFENRLYTISVCSTIVISGAIRLAKFNITPSRPYFNGLPIPANAMFFIGVVLAIETESQRFIDFFNDPIYYALTPLFLSIMMVSFGFRMFTTKGLSSDHRKNIFHYLMLLFTFLIIWKFKYESICFIILAYIFLSVINTLVQRRLEKIADKIINI